jgi:hypothetical protein
MSSLDFDLDSQMSHLETEWRHAYETSIAARADLQALGAAGKTDGGAVAKAHARLDHAENLKAHIMGKIERIEDTLLGNGS